MPAHTLISYSFPIPYSDLLSLAEKIRTGDLFTPSFSAETEDPYSPQTYLFQREIHQTRTILIADRNLFSRWVSMVQGSPFTEHHRLAAAVLAFCQCCDILIEPCVALHEVATQKGNDYANDEEAFFRIADNTNPAVWAEIALGSKESVLSPQQENQKVKEKIDFAKPLKIFRRNYIIALKLASIALKPGKSMPLIQEFIDWMYTDFIFMGAATVLGLCYFAPNGSKKGLIKQLRSPDRSRAISGLRNAAWDMTIVTHWLESVRNQNTLNQLTILGSLDKMLHVISRSMLSFSDSAKDHDDFGKRRFQQLWGSETGNEIWKRLQRHFSNSENPERAANKTHANLTIEELIVSGEKEILNWRINESA